MKRIFIILCFALSAVSCGGGGRSAADDGTMYVTIAPLAEMVTEITGGDFAVEVLVPAGASPETFEPTPRQVIALNSARAVFAVGLLDFERALTSRLDDGAKVVDLSRGIEPVAGSCAHEHNGRRHVHGIDPHIWTSPRQLLTMAANAYEAVRTLCPDSVKYERNYRAYSERLRLLDAECAEACARSERKCFVIFHPALTYFARDYGIEQIAVEHEGKEPTARQLAGIIERARQCGVRRLFYQSQFPRSTVEIVASDIGAECVELDPLASDVTDNIKRITHLITE